MTYIAVRLTSIEPVVTRSVYSDGRKSQDFDIVTFVVLRNQTVVGSGVATTPALFAEEDRGATDFPATNRTRMTPQWVVAPFEIGDGDGLTIVYTGTNISGGKIDVSAEKQSEMELKVLDTVVTALAGVPELGLIGGAVGSVLGFLGDPIGKLLGFHTTPNCDGLVFSDTVQFTGAAIKSLGYVPPIDHVSQTLPYARHASEAQFVKSYDDNATHRQECGAVARTNVRFSIIKFDAFEVGGWTRLLHPDMHLGGGISQLGSGRRPMSLRSVL